MFRIAGIAAVLLVAPAIARDNAISPDGRWRAVVRDQRQPTLTTGGVSAIWLIDTRSGKRRKLYTGGCFRGGWGKPQWSPDGRFVYFDRLESEVSAGTHQVDVRTGKEMRAFDGGLIGIVRTGPYRGYVLTQPHRYWVGGGSYNPIVLVRSDGKEILTVPGSDKDDGKRSLPRWLRAKGWKAS